MRHSLFHQLWGKDVVKYRQFPSKVTLNKCYALITLGTYLRRTPHRPNISPSGQGQLLSFCSWRACSWGDGDGAKEKKSLKIQEESRHLAKAFLASSYYLYEEDARKVVAKWLLSPSFPSDACNNFHTKFSLTPQGHSTRGLTEENTQLGIISPIGYFISPIGYIFIQLGIGDFFLTLRY